MTAIRKANHWYWQKSFVARAWIALGVVGPIILVF